MKANRHPQMCGRYCNWPKCTSVMCPDTNSPSFGRRLVIDIIKIVLASIAIVVMGAVLVTGIRVLITNAL